MNITILEVRTPTTQAGDDGVINMEVRFSHLPDFVPFSACVDDNEAHGRELYERAMAGEFGEVVVLPPLPPYEIARRDNPGLRQRNLALACERALHWDMMGDSEKAGAWRDYYRAVYVLGMHKAWPMVSQWPSPPEGEAPL
jgi:hypothetical protein